MKHTAKIVLSRAYWIESYDQGQRYASRILLIERTIGVVLILIGAGLFLYTRGETLLPAVLVAIGFLELLSTRIRKFFWLRRQLKSKLADAQIEFTFHDDGIESTGPFSTGHTKWSGVEKVVRTPQGILVWPQKGIYFYVPESLLGKEGIDFIVARVA